MSILRFDSLFIPLDGERTVHLLLADHEIKKPSKGNPESVLPDGWSGVIGDQKSIIGFDPDAERRGANQLQINELYDYYWEIFPDGTNIKIDDLVIGSSLVGSSRERDWHPKVQEKSLHGTFKYVNYLGSAWIEVSNKALQYVYPKIYFDVVTEKIDYEIEYRAMVESIASECQQLLLEWGSPTVVHISSDPEKRAQTLLEQFLFLRHVLGSEKLDVYLETIRRNAHTHLETELTWQPAPITSSRLFLSDPLRFGRRWIKANASTIGFKKGYTATEIIEQRKFDSFDTPPNRFVKFALQNFRSLSDDIINASIQGKSLKDEKGTAWLEANSMRDSLDSFLSTSFFDGVGQLGRIPYESQTLQKREGYREILHASLMLDAAAQIDWPGRSDAYDGTNRDVAVLYEYWLYFTLVRVLKTRLGMEVLEDPLREIDGALPFCCKSEDGRMVVNLKQGKDSFCRFQWKVQGEELLIHFFYNRRFSHSRVDTRGSYSKGFRPDYTLVIIPASFKTYDWFRAEQEAEREGQIAYLHFDAKYRVEKLDSIFGESEEETDQERQSAKSTGTFKNADLYKMHTYNEAIRRTVGSYVLYPGDDPVNKPNENRFERYHEIVPGVGAFAVKPNGIENESDPIGLEYLIAFLHDFLIHQASKFTEDHRIRYWTEGTIREPVEEFNSNILDFVHGNKPPIDTQMVLGFVRDDVEAEYCYQTKTFFCHAVEWDESVARSSDGSGKPGKTTDLDFDPFRSDLFVVYHQNCSTEWVADVSQVKLVSATQRASEMRRKLSEMHAAYYYRFDLINVQPAKRRDVSTMVHRRPGKPIAVSLATFASCPQLK
jgi:predicted component of viral defense system (DUF524 family)